MIGSYIVEPMYEQTLNKADFNNWPYGPRISDYSKVPLQCIEGHPYSLKLSGPKMDRASTFVPMATGTKAGTPRPV